jgi:hypothetical protein
MRKAILVGWFVIGLATWAAAQEKGIWKYHESKDDSTEEVTKYLTVYSDLPDIRLLITLNKDGDGPFVSISFPRSITTQSEVAVQWRVDEKTQIWDTWVVAEGELIGCIDNKRLLKQMLSGRRLLVKILTDKPITISFDIKGLAYYARKLELE